MSKLQNTKYLLRTCSAVLNIFWCHILHFYEDAGTLLGAWRMPHETVTDKYEKLIIFYPKVKLNNAIYLILDSWIGHYNVQRGFTSLKVRKGSQRSSSNFGKFWDSVKGLILFIQGNIFRAQIKFLFSDRKTDTTPSWRDLAHANHRRLCLKN